MKFTFNFTFVLQQKFIFITPRAEIDAGDIIERLSETKMFEQNLRPKQQSFSHTLACIRTHTHRHALTAQSFRNAESGEPRR